MFNYGLDENFLRDMERHKKQEYELLQKIAMKQGQSTPPPINVPNVLGNLVGSIPAPPNQSPTATLFSPTNFPMYGNSNVFQPNNNQLRSSNPTTPM